MGVAGKNEPDELMLPVPAGMAAGEEVLEVRAGSGVGDVRTGRLEDKLTVV